MLIRSKPKLSTVDKSEFKITYNNTYLEYVTKMRYLGVILDGHLEWSFQVGNVAK